MTSEYSIELQAENINNAKTKKYFQEVLSSYIVGNYRSSIVVLWTVTVCDLVYKLQELSTIYNDKVAEKILKEIKKKQEDNKKSPEWETSLIELIDERTSMFATYEIAHIKSLQKQRHLSAHPILKEDLNLYQPNKETTRALIRNILESVLTKPSMASNKIFDSLIEDLQEKRDLFPDINDLENYISSKYYEHIPDKVKQYIFKQLWKFVFKLNNDNSHKNRIINLKALAILYKQNTKVIQQYMQEEQDYFASSINLDAEMDIKFFVILCSKYPKIYTLIEESYKPPIIERIKKDKSLWAKSFFIYQNPTQYLEVLQNNIGLDEVSKNEQLSKKIINYCKENDAIDKLIILYIDRYTSSTSYDDADKSFDNIIEPILSSLNEEQCVYLFKKIETNDQVYNRGKAYFDHKKIKKQCDKLNDSFDYSPYKKFLKSIKD